MAAHPSISCPGESHGQKKPEGLQSIGSQRVRQNLSNFAHRYGNNTDHLVAPND